MVAVGLEPATLGVRVPAAASCATFASAQLVTARDLINLFPHHITAVPLSEKPLCEISPIIHK